MDEIRLADKHKKLLYECLGYCLHRIKKHPEAGIRVCDNIEEIEELREMVKLPPAEAKYCKCSSIKTDRETKNNECLFCHKPIVPAPQFEEIIELNYRTYNGEELIVKINALIRNVNKLIAQTNKGAR